MKTKIEVRLAYMAIEQGLDPAEMLKMTFAAFVALKRMAARRKLS